MPDDLKSVISQIKNADLSNYSRVTSYEHALEVALWVLQVYEEVMKQDDYLFADQISEILSSQKVSFNANAIGMALFRAGSMVASKRFGHAIGYKIMQKGIDHLKNLAGSGNIKVHYVDGAQPHSARIMPKEVISETKGAIRIVDPYYGIATLDMLAALDHKRNIAFLCTTFGHEDAGAFSRALKNFKKQYKNIELKKYPNDKEFHDRYIITDDTLIILGHGLKDLGGKESFMIVLKDPLSKDIRLELDAKFKQRWANSNAL